MGIIQASKANSLQPVQDVHDGGAVNEVSEVKPADVENVSKAVGESSNMEVLSSDSFLTGTVTKSYVDTPVVKKQAKRAGRPKRK